MPDLGGDPGFLRDAEDLVERGVDRVGLRALVREVGAAVARRDLRHRDQLVGRVVHVGHVLERGRDADRAVPHGLIHEVAHLLQLFRRRAAVGFADDVVAHAAGADEGREVDGAAAALEGLEVAVERREVGRESVALVDVHALGEHRGVQGRDGCALPGHLGRDALRDLRGRALVDEHVVLGLAQQVDESRRDDQAPGVDRPLCRVAGQRADRDDSAIPDSHVRDEPGGARAVDHPAAHEEQIIGGVGGREGEQAEQGREGDEQLLHAGNSIAGRPFTFGSRHRV